MRTHAYANIPVKDEEIVVVEALVHDALSLAFATGTFFISKSEEHDLPALFWPTHYTSRLVRALEGLNSFKTKGPAYALCMRVIEKANV